MKKRELVPPLLPISVSLLSLRYMKLGDMPPPFSHNAYLIVALPLLLYVVVRNYFSWYDKTKHLRFFGILTLICLIVMVRHMLRFLSHFRKEQTFLIFNFIQAIMNSSFLCLDAARLVGIFCNSIGTWVQVFVSSFLIHRKIDSNHYFCRHAKRNLQITQRYSVRAFM